MSLNIIKANTLNDKLFKCYSQIGLCNDESILFGKGPAEKESQFLFLLTLFMKNLHLADSGSLNKTITEKENLNANDKVGDEISEKNEDEVKSKECSNLLANEPCNEKYDIDKLCSEIEEINKEYSCRSHKNYEQSLQNFNASFKNISSLSVQKISTNIVSEVHSNISSDMQDIHFAFSTINKTLSNKSKIRNQPTLKNSTVIADPLTSVIKDNLVLVEQACNTFVDD